VVSLYGVEYLAFEESYNRVHCIVRQIICVRGSEANVPHSKSKQSVVIDEVKV